jgi:uncharacterized protein YbbK (DUF523 family)
MEKVLVSSCLLGKRVRYDGKALTVSDKIIGEWQRSGRLVSVCPEVDVGMSVPRPPAEIRGGDGYGVFAGSAYVVDDTDIDVTAYFKKGAHVALEICKKHNIKIAVLTENSPSCGSATIYDGSFTGRTIDGIGVTAALLKKNGVEVFSQYSIKEANKVLLRENL